MDSRRLEKDVGYTLKQGNRDRQEKWVETIKEFLWLQVGIETLTEGLLVFVTVNAVQSECCTNWHKLASGQAE